MSCVVNFFDAFPLSWAGSDSCHTMEASHQLRAGACGLAHIPTDCHTPIARCSAWKAAGAFICRAMSSPYCMHSCTASCLITLAVPSSPVCCQSRAMNQLKKSFTFRKALPSQKTKFQGCAADLGVHLQHKVLRLATVDTTSRPAKRRTCPCETATESVADHRERLDSIACAYNSLQMSADGRRR
jgi:hypothetical protein